ncbi:hypothetical protein J1N10_00655 [Carboxylicivirga sp. A043]|uniref:hypothetical protein n=1 Tax=Carboxylicivirga litoralis TaxID=2816963 RepID=UPI0021CB3630|nr:hypothetical protein [Carboxylicivirga sp. A043]MCU4154468.1 hypothetical protein [Carboxylicivirga sp. A043]
MNLKAIALCCLLVSYCLISEGQEAVGKNTERKVEDTMSTSRDTIAAKRIASAKNLAMADSSLTDSVVTTTPYPSTTDTTLNIQEATTTVIKGYSPFTNYTDTFKVNATIRDTATVPAPNLQLQKRLAALNDTTIQQSSDNFIHQSDIKYSKSSLTELWHNYINTSYTSSVSQNDSAAMIIAENIEERANALTTNNNAEFKQASKQDESNHITQVMSLAKPATEQAKPAPTLAHNDSICYFMQIAAARTELTTTEIKFVNKTNADYRIITENGWFKYQLPLGSDYIMARQSINAYPGKQVFLVAYKGHKRLNLWETVKHIELQTPKQDDLLFVVQIAASRSPLSETEKNKLVSPADNVRMVHEDGWYKYQIITGSSYQLTLNKCKLIGISKSFPVAYLSGEKIDMAQAIKMTITNN